MADEPTLTAIMDAMKRPEPLKLELVKQFLDCQLPYMGMPKRLTPSGKPGRPSKKTQYDHARERRERLPGILTRRLHQTETLPKLGRASGWLANADYRAIFDAVCAEPKISANQRAAEIVRRCEAGGLKCPPERMPSLRTVLRHLKTNEFKPPCVT